MKKQMIIVGFVFVLGLWLYGSRSTVSRISSPEPQKSDRGALRQNFDRQKDSAKTQSRSQTVPWQQSDDSKWVRQNSANAQSGSAPWIDTTYPTARILGQYQVGPDSDGNVTQKTLLDLRETLKSNLWVEETYQTDSDGNRHISVFKRYAASHFVVRFTEGVNADEVLKKIGPVGAVGINPVRGTGFFKIVLSEGAAHSPDSFQRIEKALNDLGTLAESSPDHVSQIEPIAQTMQASPFGI